mmetsp:Transcript_31768/g.105246  ORF Transcript_31768/g.105246 Transcript_31768/m.105246 type:complete len:295 (-) Transcript_31768:185-1069(-)
MPFPRRAPARRQRHARCRLLPARRTRALGGRCSGLGLGPLWHARQQTSQGILQPGPERHGAAQEASDLLSGQLQQHTDGLAADLKRIAHGGSSSTSGSSASCLTGRRASARGGSHGGRGHTVADRGPGAEEEQLAAQLQLLCRRWWLERRPRQLLRDKLEGRGIDLLLLLLLLCFLLLLLWWRFRISPFPGLAPSSLARAPIPIQGCGSWLAWRGIPAAGAAPLVLERHAVRHLSSWLHDIGLVSNVLGHVYHACAVRCHGIQADDVNAVATVLHAVLGHVCHSSSWHAKAKTS